MPMTSLGIVVDAGSRQSFAKHGAVGVAQAPETANEVGRKDEESHQTTGVIRRAETKSCSLSAPGALPHPGPRRAASSRPSSRVPARPPRRVVPRARPLVQLPPLAVTRAHDHHPELEPAQEELEVLKCAAQSPPVSAEQLEGTEPQLPSLEHVLVLALSPDRPDAVRALPRGSAGQQRKRRTEEGAKNRSEEQKSKRRTEANNGGCARSTSRLRVLGSEHAAWQPRGSR